MGNAMGNSIGQGKADLQQGAAYGKGKGPSQRGDHQTGVGRGQPTEAELGLLINRCGKMRMLSHRAVMIALLNSAETDSAAPALGWSAFRQCTEEFRNIASDLESFALSGHMPSLATLLRKEGSPFETFLKTAHLVESSSPKVRHAQINDLAHFVAGPLLDMLNQCVAAISSGLEALLEADRARMGRSREIIQGTAADIAQISQAVFMISVNASIEASRAGDQGRGFSILANEIRTLSQTSAKSVQALQDELADFIA